jgi:transcriptional regulator with XRE-family HTH domain
MSEKTMYTDEQMEYVRAEYTANPSRETVDRLAEELDKPFRSIIAKLVFLELYEVPKRTSKDGREIRSKADMIKEIEAWLGIAAPSLEKAGKLDLQKLHAALKDPLVVRAHLTDLEYEEN